MYTNRNAFTLLFAPFDQCQSNWEGRNNAQMHLQGSFYDYKFYLLYITHLKYNLIFSFLQRTAQNIVIDRFQLDLSQY